MNRKDFTAASKLTLARNERNRAQEAVEVAREDYRRYDKRLREAEERVRLADQRLQEAVGEWVEAGRDR